ncbi:MAG: ATP-binding protein [Caulobacter sp.]
MTLLATRSRSELKWILFLGLLVITIVLAAGLGTLSFAARAVDHAVANEERDLVTRTLARRQARLVQDITSATVWDDAYQNTVLSFDPTWVHDNFGVYYATYMRHDRTLVFAPDGRVIYAADAGEVVPPTAETGFVDDLKPLMARFRADERRGLASDTDGPHGLDDVTTTAALVQSGGALWLVAISNIVPETTDVRLAAGPSAAVLSGRRLDGPFLAELQSDLGIRQARLLQGDGAAAGPSLPLRDAQGTVIGRFRWTPKQPGAGFLKDALGPILLVLAAFFVAVGALARRVIAALNSLAANDAKLESTLADLTVARDHAEAASVAKSEFLANISHEIRTPLNGVLGMAQIMDRGELAPAQREHLAIIRESGATLLTLLNDVLDLAKIEAGKLEIRREDVALGKIVSAVCDTFQAVAEVKGVALGCAIAPGAAGAWRLDPMRVSQVLANLLSNAVKFTARGQVSVRVEASPDGLMFSVIDTGPGIPADRLQDLFGKFNQLDASTTRSFGGSGLGLAICRDLVALMSGEMSVESTVGRGSTFRVLLPAEPARASGSA